MDLVLFGMNHTTAPLKIRELLSFKEEDSRRIMTNLRSDKVFKETLMLCTCNRTEVYGLADEPDKSMEELLSVFTDLSSIEKGHLLDQGYSHYNIQAINHLFKVSAGLDSMVLGEVEIVGQLKDAYRNATSVDATGPYLNRLFHHCFRVGKRARNEASMSAGGYSIGSSGVDLAVKVLGSLEKKRVLMIGAGETGQLVARHLIHRGIGELVITNRTQSKADDIAHEMNSQTLPFDDYPARIPEFDLVISAVGAPNWTVDRKMLKKKHGGFQLFIDLGVPRDIDPEIQKASGVFVYNIDDLNSIVQDNLAKRANEIPKVEKIIEEETAKFISWNDSLRAQNTIVDLKNKLEEIKSETLTKWERKLTPQEYEKVKKITHELVQKILFEPANCLKGCELKDASRDCSYCDMFLPSKGCIHGHYNQELKCAITRSLFNLNSYSETDKKNDDKR